MKKNDEAGCRSMIREKYKLLGYKQGWTFLYGPFRNMWTPKYPVAFFGLNPGGSEVTDQELVSVEKGSAYRIENWGVDENSQSPLQQQLIDLYTRLAKEMNMGIHYDELMDESLMANLVPFRSKSWNGLREKETALLFSREFWRERIGMVPTALYVTMSKISFNEISKLLVECGYQEDVGKSVLTMVGWGKVTYQISEYHRNDIRTTVIRLPHLSRYKIFGREPSEPAINDIMSVAGKQLREFQ